MLSVLAPLVAVAPLLLGVVAEVWRWWRRDPDRALRRLTRRQRNGRS